MEEEEEEAPQGQALTLKAVTSKDLLQERGVVMGACHRLLPVWTGSMVPVLLVRVWVLFKMLPSLLAR
jgi:hypothetical protein